MFRRERKRLGLKQSELAEKLGVTRVCISLWETGKSRPQQRHIQILLELGFHKAAIRSLYLSDLDCE